jgi:hypothetical protein
MAVQFFETPLRQGKPNQHFGDPQVCIKQAYADENNKAHTLRTRRSARRACMVPPDACTACMCAVRPFQQPIPRRYMGQSLASAILRSSGDSTSSFVLLTGVGDSTNSQEEELHTWDLPPAAQDKCYLATASHPAADVAAQVATALALVARALYTHGTPEDRSASVAGLFEEKAVRAFDYAADAFEERAHNSTCMLSGAAHNCVGRCKGAPATTVRKCMLCMHWLATLSRHSSKLETQHPCCAAHMHALHAQARCDFAPQQFHARTLTPVLHCSLAHSTPTMSPQGSTCSPQLPRCLL